MRTRNKIKRIRIVFILLSFTLLVTSFSPVYATQTVDTVESELSSLEKELETLNKETDHIISEIKTTTSELEYTRDALAVAKGNEIAQYESMMTRIKYMYENGNTTIVEMLFSSKCLAEFISCAEYFSAINEHDRSLLEEYTANHKAITEHETALKEKQAHLQSLQSELSQKEKIIKEKISSTSNNLESLLSKLEKSKEEAKKAEEEAKKEVKPVIPEKPKEELPSEVPPTIKDNGAVTYTEKEVELLAALIECEAGHSDYEALLAVGAVVVNRMKHANYPNTVTGVIYQSGQFPPATDGKMDRILERGVKPLCITAATDALNGKSNVKDCISFRSASSGRPGVIIGDNVFFF